MTDLRAVRLPSQSTRAILLLCALAVCAGWLGSLPAEAQAPLIIRMATLVPDGSSWYQILKETGERWKQASGGRVTVRLFPGGVAGDDPDVVRKMRLGTLNAGVLTSVGVAEIDKSVYAMGIPLMYDSYEEVDCPGRCGRSSRRALRPWASWYSTGSTAAGCASSRRAVAAPDDLRALALLLGGRRPVGRGPAPAG
jgi:TRAP-type C4-dicarboxylate transport system substrate-binding protein